MALRAWLTLAVAIGLAGCANCREDVALAGTENTAAPPGPVPELREASSDQLSELCDSVPALACGTLGERLRHAEGDAAAARGAYQRGCEAGDGDACVELGRMWRMGQGGERSNSDALSWYRVACEHEAPMGCNNAGILTRDGQGTEADRDAALGLFEQACRADYWVGCEAFGRLVMAEGLGHASADEARSALERACVEGSEPLACIALAEWAADLEDDPAVARATYSRACNLDDVPGCVEFARLAHAGVGGPADQPLARQLLDLGCRRGVLAACVDIARIYEGGDGVEPDADRAEAFMRHACEAGWTAACIPEPAPGVTD